MNFCTKCDKLKTDDKYKWCEPCREDKRIWERERKAKFLLENKCYGCGKSNSNGKLYCDNCGSVNNLNSKKSKNKKQSLKLCRDCSNPSTQGTLCDSCADKGNQRSKLKIEELKEKGLCTKCRSRESSDGSMCQNCRDDTNLKNYGLKKETINYYGGKCSCCGESHLEFLTLDHIENNGAKERQEITGKKKGGGGVTYYRRLKKKGYPSGYQVLCWNCNQGKHLNKGICPHKGIQIDLNKDHYKVKIKVINNYGGKCNCCEESGILFLSIDHINGDGAKFRKEEGINGGHHTYLWLKRNKYPTGFQVLCLNCNSAKGLKSECPHQKLLAT